ncbi:hypothetical protein [Parendozoicomonas haliclonae]|uniref:Outer membrane porin, OprD family n=1 Tax=Parendozoicomonas haliclonae TaxID=1960125 RepID=A0A1X7ARN1_9GAMM|nr:hypothetical protein [Parendozoicomonas haliclonae]SMA50758.1 outer membrane porin, OprD family [Parendozoicomonas haliclonae]
MFKKNSLACAVILAAASQGTVASEMSDFLTGGSFNMELKTVGIDRDRDNHPALGDEAGLAQGVRLMYTTGKLFDRISLSANYYQSIKIHGQSGKGKTLDLLEINEDGDQDSYQKLGISARFHFNEKSFIQAGRSMINYPLLNDNNAYTTPGLTEAVNAEWGFGKGRVYGAYITGGNHRNKSDFVDYGLDGEKKPISLAGFDYNFGASGSRIEASAGQQDDYSNNYWLRGVITRQLDGVKLALDNRYFGKKLTGKTQDKVKEGGDDYSWFASSMLTAQYGDYTLSYSFQTVSDAEGFREALKGTFYKNGWHRWAGGDDFTKWGGSNHIYSMSFDKNDMDSHSLKFGHNLRAYVPGLSYFIRHTQGDWKDYNNNNKTLTDKATDLNINYAVQNPALKGLAANLVIQNNEEEKAKGGTQTMLDTRLTIVYRKSFY